jgi:8-oxo-dGTP pyrophosphatase MutT (NUDIX family)
MSYLQHIDACNRHRPEAYLPFVRDGRRVGRVRKDLAAQLTGMQGVFLAEAAGVTLDPALAHRQARTAIVGAAMAGLAGQGIGLPFTGEAFPVKTAFLDPPLFAIDRGSVQVLGVRSWGIHLNGFVRGPDGLKMWVSRRSAGDPLFGGQLDNLAAGGCALGATARETLVKEAEEEAGIDAGLMESAVAVGIVTYLLDVEQGLRDEQVLVYDLELPADFQPHNRDGEADAFHLWPVAEVARVLRHSFAFKFNCALVAIDFLIRHGAITPDEEPDYARLVEGLRQGGSYADARRP